MGFPTRPRTHNIDSKRQMANHNTYTNIPRYRQIRRTKYTRWQPCVSPSVQTSSMCHSTSPFHIYNPKHQLDYKRVIWLMMSLWRISATTEGFPVPSPVFCFCHQVSIRSRWCAGILHKGLDPCFYRLHLLMTCHFYPHVAFFIQKHLSASSQRMIVTQIPPCVGVSVSLLMFERFFDFASATFVLHEIVEL